MQLLGLEAASTTEPMRRGGAAGVHAAEDDDKDSGRFYMAMIHQLNGFRNFEKLTVFTTNFYLKKPFFCLP